MTAPPSYLVGVQGGWHAIDPADVLPGCVDHRWSVCGTLVRRAIDNGGDPKPYDWQSLPVSYDPCPACMWIVAARTGTLGAVLDALTGIARDAAADILNVAGREEREPDDDETLHLLTAVSRHVPVLLLREECAEEECPGGDCTHDGRLACRACSLQAGGWAGEREGTYLYECTIPAPCAVLLELARTARAVVAANAIGALALPPAGEVSS